MSRREPPGRHALHSSFQGKEAVAHGQGGRSDPVVVGGDVPAGPRRARRSGQRRTLPRCHARPVVAHLGAGEAAAVSSGKAAPGAPCRPDQAMSCCCGSGLYGTALAVLPSPAPLDPLPLAAVAFTPDRGSDVMGIGGSPALPHPASDLAIPAASVACRGGQPCPGRSCNRWAREKRRSQCRDGPFRRGTLWFRAVHARRTWLPLSRAPGTARPGGPRWPRTGRSGEPADAAAEWANRVPSRGGSLIPTWMHGLG